MAQLSLAISAVSIFIALVIGNRELSEIGLKGVAFPLAVALLVGFLADRISSAGGVKKYHKVSIGDLGLTIQVSENDKVMLDWPSITKIEDFGIGDLQVLDPNHKTPDFWISRGVGGFRVFTEDGGLYRIYRTLQHYKVVRAEVIRRSPCAVLFKNGRMVSRSRAGA
jgi:hypothetical protein